MKTPAALCCLALLTALQPAATAGLITEYTILSPPDASYFGAAWVNGINNHNVAVATYAQGNGMITRGFLFNGTYATVDAPVNYVDAGPYINGINDSGDYVGYWQTGPASGGTGFVHNDSGFTVITTPDGVNTNVRGINNAGTLAGTYFDNGLHGFIRNGQTWTTLDHPDSTQDTMIFGINNLGQVVGQYYGVDGLAHSFLWDGNTFTEISILDTATGTMAQGLNDNGDVVGYIYDTNGMSHGFLWNSGNWITMDLAGFDVAGTSLLGINNYGSMVGQYIDDSGIHSFMVTPEPGTALLGLLALLPLLFSFRRHSRRRHKN